MSELGPFILQQRTWGDRIGESDSCHKETHALQQTGLLFDHLVGAGEQRPQLARREFLQSD
jgi:hypothetical protein